MAALNAFGAILLFIAALINPRLWKPYHKDAEASMFGTSEGLRDMALLIYPQVSAIAKGTTQLSKQSETKQDTH